MSRSRFAAAAAAVAIALPAAAQRADPGTAPVAAPPVAATRALPDFSTLVERHGGAVVNISTVERTRPATEARPVPPEIDPNDPMLEFFRRFGIPGPEARRE